MAFAKVQSATETTDTLNPSAIVTLPGNCTTGNLLVVAIVADNGHDVSSVSGLGTWSALHEIDTASVTARLYGCLATSAGTQVTVTMTGNASFTSLLHLIEFSGPLSPLTESGTSTGADNSGAPVTAHDCAAITPDTSETLFIGVCALTGNPTTWTPDADFTQDLAPATPNWTSVQYLIQSGNTNAQAWNNTSSTSRTSRLAFAAVRGASAALDPIRLVWRQ